METTKHESGANDGQQQENNQNTADQGNTNNPVNYDELAEQADEERTRKPGSQSNSSDQHNNGRGGGK